MGGVLPPFLWLVHFGKLEKELAEARKGWGEELKGAEVLVLCYADDVAFLISHTDPEVAALAAGRCAEDVSRILGVSLGLVLEAAKSFNLVASPGHLASGRFRRAEGACFVSLGEVGVEQTRGPTSYSKSAGIGGSAGGNSCLS